jgi:GDP/UDP-N,N'-diacetylbacillosamine 2-epimerase (hydrolysing)
VVGNSSSGLLEVPSFKKGTINIGDRQKGRLKAESVIDCKPKWTSILNAIDHLFSKKFQKKLPMINNPYGNGGASKKIIKILEKQSLSNLLKKSFYNLKSL